MRKFEYLLLLSLLTLTLASCASLDASLELHEDGSGTRTVLVLVDETAYNLALTTGGDPLALITPEAGQRGATVEPYAEYARRGLRLTQSFDRLGDIPALPPLDDVRASRQSDLLGSHYAITITVDTAQLVTATQGMPGVPANDLKLTYHMTLPGRIRAHNADTIAENTLTWTLDPAAGDMRTLVATSEVPRDLTVPYLGVVIVLGVLGLALVGGLALASARRRRRTDRASGVLSGCLGLAMLIALLGCLMLTLLTSYLALEGRIL
ncbi:MAG: hypothetical protein KJ734_12820 [Chloroflexi bacterium]|nr:hypothetical protein [Chloroflexota bacterium]